MTENQLVPSLRHIRFVGGTTASHSDRLRVVQFLTEQLRSKVDYTIDQEYPSLFGAYPGGDSLFVEKEGQIVCHVGCMVREFQHPQFRMKVGLIGSVVTDFRFRGEGFASQLLREAIRILKSKGCQSAVLWSDKPDFYQPLGFFRAGREHDFRFTPESVGDSIESLREGFDDGEVNRLWRLYHRGEYRLDRSLEEMKALLRVPAARVFITEREGLLTSYFVVNKGADFTNYIHEWAGDTLSLADGISTAQKTYFAENPLTLIAPAQADTADFARIAEQDWEGVLGMMKVLDRTELLKTYQHYLQKVEIPASWEADRLAVTIGETRFALGTDREVLNLVFGGEEKATHPALPFFLWGFDSI